MLPSRIALSPPVSKRRFCSPFCSQQPNPQAVRKRESYALLSYTMVKLISSAGSTAVGKGVSTRSLSDSDCSVQPTLSRRNARSTIRLAIGLGLACIALNPQPRAFGAVVHGLCPAHPRAWPEHSASAVLSAWRCLSAITLYCSWSLSSQITQGESCAPLGARGSPAAGATAPRQLRGAPVQMRWGMRNNSTLHQPAAVVARQPTSRMTNTWSGG